MDTVHPGPQGSSKEYRKNWSRRIQKIYEVDPITCPKCQGRMKIISFIEDKEVIKKDPQAFSTLGDKGTTFA